MKREALLLLCLLTASCAQVPENPHDSNPLPDEQLEEETPTLPQEGDSSPESPAQEPESVPVIGDVVLNEISYDVVGGDTDGVLFVELHGTPDLVIGGCKIHFVNGSDGTITESVSIPETARLGLDGFYLIADSKDGSSTETNVSGADLIDNFDPQNGPDSIQLVDSNGELVDAVGYGEGIVTSAENGLPTFEGVPAMDVVNGHSLERSVPGLDTGDNFTDFVDRPVPTPGQ